MDLFEFIFISTLFYIASRIMDLDINTLFICLMFLYIIQIKNRPTSWRIKILYVILYVERGLYYDWKTKNII
jgi:hypothetical protein